MLLFDVKEFTTTRTARFAAFFADGGGWGADFFIFHCFRWLFRAFVHVLVHALVLRASARGYGLSIASLAVAEDDAVYFSFLLTAWDACGACLITFICFGLGFLFDFVGRMRSMLTTFFDDLGWVCVIWDVVIFSNNS